MILFGVIGVVLAILLLGLFVVMVFPPVILRQKKLIASEFALETEKQER